MRVVDLASQGQVIRDAAAELLVSGFKEPRGWPNVVSAQAEVAHVLREGFARAVLVDDELVGWIGALPEYHGRVWELHPLVVRGDYRRRGIGRVLVGALEQEIRVRGGLTVTLGTDDDSGMTSLADVDLYADVLMGRSRPGTAAGTICVVQVTHERTSAAANGHDESHLQGTVEPIGLAIALVDNNLARSASGPLTARRAAGCPLHGDN